MSEAPAAFSRRDELAVYNTPEKAYIRSRWIHYARQRLNSTMAGDIRYFTLPGVGCYDIITFQQNNLLRMDSATQFNERSLAFCEKNPEKFARIRDKLTNARAYYGRYEQFIGAGQFNVSREANAWFPFDVINLDFTGPLLQPKGLLDSIRKTVLIQNQYHCGFTLYVTIKCDESWESEERINELKENMNTNLTQASTAEFRSRFLERYPNYGTGEIPFCELMLYAIPKLLIRDGIDKAFDVNSEERFLYIGTGNQSTMLAFILNYEYRGLEGIHGAEPNSDLVNSYPMKVRSLAEAHFVNINQFFEAQPAAKSEAEETCRVLATI